MRGVCLTPKRMFVLSLRHDEYLILIISRQFITHLNLTMIVPYFNTILISHSKNSADLSHHQLQLMQQYLQELLVSNCGQKQIEIRIGFLGTAIKQSIGEQIKRLIGSLFGQMKQIVWQINGRYSTRQQSKLIYQALSKIEIKGGTNQKQPVQLQNLQLLRDYYSRYKSEAEMKDFLKNLLIEEISLEKKTIRYRKAQQVEMLLQVMAAQISGEIEITYKLTSLQKQQSHKTIVWVLMASKDELKNMNTNELMRKIERQYKIDRSVSQIITQNITIEAMELQSQAVLKQIVLKYYSLKSAQFRDTIKQLKHCSNLLSNIKIVQQYGMKLWEDQQLLNRQFLQFLQEMRTKYSSAVSQYVQGWRQQLQFIKKQQHYQNYLNNIRTINKYMVTVKQTKQLTVRRKGKNIENCRMIQTRIRSYLLVKAQQHRILNSYLQSKTIELCAENKLYEQIKQLYNHYQLQKLANCNNYKYGFACTTHIVAVNNHSSYSGFAAEGLLQFIQRANKHRQIVVKLKCEQSYLQATTIEGKVYLMGCRKSSMSIGGSCNKKNQWYSNNSGNASAKSSNFSSRILQTSTSNRTSMSQTKFNSKWNSASTDCKETMIVNKQVADYEMKLDQNGRLFVCGDNTYGHLGLADKYVNTFTCILPAHRVKLYSTINHHTIIITTDNKVFHCGKGKSKFPQSNTPQQIVLKDKIAIKQIVNTINDTYFLTDRHKIYSLSLMNFIIIPKPIQLQMEHFQLVRTGTYNLQIVYLVACWTNTLDKLQKEQICRYLTSNNEMESSQNESILVDDLSLCGEVDRNRIGDLSAILQSPLQ